MSQGFIPEGDKLHQMQPQRPGAFICITEQGRIIEAVALMESQQMMYREWEILPWDQAKVDAETARVQQEIVKMQSHGPGPQQQARPGIIKPGQIARPGTI